MNLEGENLTMSCRLDAPITEGLPQIMEVRPYLSLNQFCGASNCINYYNTNDFRANVMKSWDKIEKEGDGRTIPFEVTVPVNADIFTLFVWEQKLRIRLKNITIPK